jgi:hypothetical protein
MKERDAVVAATAGRYRKAQKNRAFAMLKN